MTTQRNKKLLNDFAKYCKKYPEERFWQALRNWSNYNFIYVSNESIDLSSLKDTFYWEEKNE